MGAICGTRIRKRRQSLGLTQAELAEKTGLSETAIRSYELGNRNPKDGHREVIAKALEVSPDYLREHEGYSESAVMHFLMEMEGVGYIRPILIDGVAYIMPVQANLEDSVQEWAEKEFEYAIGNLSEEDYLRWKAEYDPAGAQKRIKSGGANSHFDWKKAKMGDGRLEEELVKLPSDSDCANYQMGLSNL